MFWIRVSSYLSPKKMQNLVPQDILISLFTLLEYLNNLRGIAMVTRSDWDQIVLLGFIIKYVFIYLMFIIFVIRYCYLLIISNYDKYFRYAISFTILSTL